MIPTGFKQEIFLASHHSSPSQFSPQQDLRADCSQCWRRDRCEIAKIQSTPRARSKSRSLAELPKRAYIVANTKTGCAPALEHALAGTHEHSRHKMGSGTLACDAALPRAQACPLSRTHATSRTHTLPASRRGTQNGATHHVQTLHGRCENGPSLRAVPSSVGSCLLHAASHSV
eukprot:4906881-Pleurochrysis_carterae.AAC.2